MNGIGFGLALILLGLSLHLYAKLRQQREWTDFMEERADRWLSEVIAPDGTSVWPDFEELELIVGFPAREHLDEPLTDFIRREYDPLYMSMGPVTYIGDSAGGELRGDQVLLWRNYQLDNDNQEAQT